MPVVVSHLLSQVIAQLMGNFALCPGKTLILLTLKAYLNAEVPKWCLSSLRIPQYIRLW